MVLEPLSKDSHATLEKIMIGIQAHPSKKGYVVVETPLKATCGSNVVDKVKLMPTFGSGFDYFCGISCTASMLD